MKKTYYFKFRGKRLLKKSLSIILLFLPVVLSAQKITLDEAINLAMQKNEKINQYKEKLIQKEYKDKEALGNFLPTISLQSSYNHLNDNMSIDLSPIREAIIQLQTNDQVELANIYNLINKKTALTQQERAYVAGQAYDKLNSLLPAFEQTFKRQDYKSASFVAVQPIFMGGKLLAAKNYSSSEKKAAEIELTKTQNEVIQETFNNYIVIILLDQIINTRKEVLAGMLRHKEDAEKLVTQGLIAPHNLLRAEVALADARKNLFDDNNKKELALISLKHTIGLSEDTDINISDSLIFRSIPDSLILFLESANKNQPLLELIAQKKEAASQKFKAERAELLPQIAGFGKYEIFPEYLSSIEPRWIVGIQLNMKLFEGLKRWDRMQEAEHLEKEVEYLEKYTQSQINLWVNKSYRDMRNAQYKYDMLEANIKLGKENLRQNEKRFQTGLCTSLEVIDARLNLEKNEIERLTTLYEYYKAMNDLLAAIGKSPSIKEIWQSDKTSINIFKQDLNK